jgi:hypothetical protein
MHVNANYARTYLVLHDKMNVVPTSQISSISNLCQIKNLAW